MADWIDGRRLPDRATAVAPRVAAVIRHYIGLPKQLAGVGIECHHAAAEGAAMIDGEGRDWGRVIEERQRLFLRRDTHINDITEDHWRAGDHGRDMAIDLGNPMFGPGSAVGGDDVSAVVGAEPGFNIADDDIVAMDGRTVAGDRPGDPIVVGNLV